VKEVKVKARDFNFVDFAHQNRSSNVDAHNLARSLISFVLGRHVWLLTKPGQNTRYPLPIPELPEPEVPNPKFG
jgi:hypothetical protein